MIDMNCEWSEHFCEDFIKKYDSGEKFYPQEKANCLKLFREHLGIYHSNPEQYKSDAIHQSFFFKIGDRIFMLYVVRNYNYNSIDEAISSGNGYAFADPVEINEIGGINSSEDVLGVYYNRGFVNKNSFMDS